MARPSRQHLWQLKEAREQSEDPQPVAQGDEKHSGWGWRNWNLRTFKGQAAVAALRDRMETAHPEDGQTMVPITAAAVVALAVVRLACLQPAVTATEATTIWARAGESVAGLVADLEHLALRAVAVARVRAVTTAVPEVPEWNGMRLMVLVVAAVARTMALVRQWVDCTVAAGPVLLRLRVLAPAHKELSSSPTLLVRLLLQHRRSPSQPSPTTSANGCPARVLAPTADSGLPGRSSAVTSGPATISGDTVTLTGANGTVTIEATQAGNGYVRRSDPRGSQFQRHGAETAQTITFPAIPTKHPADAPFALAAASDSGLAVSYAVTSGPATVSGNTVTLTGTAGSVTIQATQVGNGTYSAATPISQTFAVSALTAQTITFPPLSNGSANDPPFVLIGTSDSGLALSYAVTSGLATISGNAVTVTGVGVVTIQATQAGNSIYAPATPVSQSFTVAPAQRGCLAFDQIKASDRTGNGNRLLIQPGPSRRDQPRNARPGGLRCRGLLVFLLWGEPVGTNRSDRPWQCRRLLPSW